MDERPVKTGECHQEAGTCERALPSARVIRHFLDLLAVGVWLGGVAGPEACAQLAITEVMSSGTTNCTGVGNPYPDFWELTNFGTNTIDLTGYRVWDSLVTSFDDFVPLTLPPPNTPPNIGPGESIIFVQDNRATPEAADAFRAWWGDTNLPSGLKIYSLGTAMRFDAGAGETVFLWDANSNLVDVAQFPEAQLFKGVTFISDPITGEFGLPSRLGCGARAASCGDVGSPGFAGGGPIPLSITQQPMSQTNDAGSDVTFHVQAIGLPRPRYQWYFNGAPVPGAPAVGNTILVVVNYAGCGLAWRAGPSARDLRMANVQPSDAGPYFVVISNGLEQLTSDVVTLTVYTSHTPARIECPPTEWLFPPLAGQPQTNLIISSNQTAVFDVVARGYPPPTFRWSWSADGTSFTDLPGATNHTLVIPSAQPGTAGTYRVSVANPLGTTQADATLTVKPKPALRITEAMSFSWRGPGFDWWELTNVGDEAVNLTGYRWDDEPAIPGGGPTVTNAVTIQAGESVIFLEDKAPDSFIQSWGAEHLPPNLQFVLYAANGLSEVKDEITLWNQSAMDDSEFNRINSVSFAGATQGVSFWFDPSVCFPEVGRWSSEGECGVIRAANGCDVGSPGCDIGSPGWTRWTPPRLTEIKDNGSSVILRWKAQPGSTNRLQFSRELAHDSGTNWTNLGAYSFAGATGTATDDRIGSDPQRFYRVVRVAPAGCECPDE